MHTGLTTRAGTPCCWLGMACLLVTPLVAGAQGLRTQRIIVTALAVEAAQTAVKFCADKGWNVSVVVVDLNGDTLVSIRDDRAGIHTLDIARRKAFTAAAARAPTAVWGANIAAGRRPPDPNLVYAEPLLFAPGGVPIMVGAEAVGAIGVSGGIGPDADASCANAGIAKVVDRLR
jgi:uncharacterized protein GlcG (DUF336 family)